MVSLLDGDDGLRRNGFELSTLDLVRRNPVLFGLGDWVRAGAVAAERLGVGLDVYRVGADVEDPGGEFGKAYGIDGAGAVLVRPDGFIAWRTNGSDEDAEGVVGEALARSLCRDAVRDT